jgi:hypothetical protein
MKSLPIATVAAKTTKILMVCLLGLPLALSGCVTAEEMAAQRAEFKAQVATADDSECRSYGAEPGTPVYVQCRMTKDQQRAQEAAASQAEYNQRLQCSVGQLTAAAAKPQNKAWIIASNC